jgi:proteasome lid subunit RPN8/RPN11
MQSDSPDIREIEQSGITEKKFLIRDHYRISLSAVAYSAMHSHAYENRGVEICGVMVGDVFQDQDGPYLEISDVIRGEYADNKMGEVTFTHDTWSHINDVKDSAFPDKKIVGWYHSHPDFGIFLSSHDMFIQQNFFAQPFQVAFVIDPVRDEEGFFFWQNGRAVNSEYYWLEGIKRLTSRKEGNQKQAISDNMEEQLSLLRRIIKARTHPIFLISLLVLLCVTLLLNYRILLEQRAGWSMAQQPNRQELIQIQDTRDLELMLAENDMLATQKVHLLRSGNRVWCSGEVITYRHKDIVYNLVRSAPDIEIVDIGGIRVTHRYQVKPGDNLASISQKIYGNQSKWREIYRRNRQLLSSVNKLPAWIEIVIPEE